LIITFLCGIGAGTICTGAGTVEIPGTTIGISTVCDSTVVVVIEVTFLLDALTFDVIDGTAD
jgi:hypothetical protein